MILKYKSCLLSIFLLIVGEPVKGQEALSVPEKIVQDTSFFRFAPGKNMFWASYKGNEKAISSFSGSLREHRTAIDAGTVKVRVRGFCDSYGSYKENLAAAKNRSNQVKSYFIVHEGLKEVHFRTTNSTHRWRGMSDVVIVTYLFPESGRRIEMPMFPGIEPDPVAGSASKAGKNPEPELLPEPDSSSVRPPKNDAIARTESAEDQENEIISPERETSVAENSTGPKPDMQQLVVGALEGRLNDYVLSRSRWAVKTNVAYLAATVANLGVEYRFGDHYSVDLPVIYSPYTVARDYRLRFLAVQPEFRYWLGNPMRGHFFGAHLNIGAFNISVDKKNRYQSPDGFYGAGLSYGYALPFARHWGAEFTVGAGYVHTKYDAYYNIPNGARYEKGIPYNYWGLTKVGINLVYRFGK
jgi:hypothetical protein